MGKVTSIILENDRDLLLPSLYLCLCNTSWNTSELPRSNDEREYKWEFDKRRWGVWCLILSDLDIENAESASSGVSSLLSDTHPTLDLKVSSILGTTGITASNIEITHVPRIAATARRSLGRSNGLLWLDYIFHGGVTAIGCLRSKKICTSILHVRYVFEYYQ